MKNVTRFRFVAGLFCALLIVFSTKGYSQVLYGYEVYAADAGLLKGEIFELIMWPPSQPQPFPKPVYTSNMGRISSLAIGPDGLAYYIDANRFEIYRTNGSGTNEVFRHTTYIRDLAFNAQGVLFFSESSGSGNNGVIYQLDMARRQASVFRQVPLSETDGSWSGNFAFDPSGILYVSSGNRRLSSIFQENGGHFIKKYTSQESITGFTFVNSNTLLFTDHQKTLFKLDNFASRSVFISKDSFKMLSDVAITRKPGGSCSISGNLLGGQKYWSMTYMGARGPNLMWRETVEQVRINTDGSYIFRNLSPGKYKVYTDMRADVGTGFTPSQRIVECTGTAAGINFQWPTGK